MGHYFLLLQNDQYFVYVFAGWIITLALILLIAWRKRQMINGILCSEFLLLNIPHLCEKLSDTFLLLKWINIFQERHHVAQFEPRNWKLTVISLTNSHSPVCHRKFAVIVPPKRFFFFNYFCFVTISCFVIAHTEKQ